MWLNYMIFFMFYITKLLGIFFFCKKINANDIIMLVNGSHGFKVLKDVEMIEVKQGPYNVSQDKIKFNEVDEKKIKIR